MGRNRGNKHRFHQDLRMNGIQNIVYLRNLKWYLLSVVFWGQIFLSMNLDDIIPNKLGSFSWFQRHSVLLDLLPLT